MFLINFLLIFVDDSLQSLIVNIEKLHQPPSSPKRLLCLGINNYGVSSPNIVPVEVLVFVDLIFLRSSCCQAEINDRKIFPLWIRVLHSLDSLLIFKQILISIFRVSVDILVLPNRPELLFLFRPRHRILSLLLLDLLIRVNLHP